MNASKLFPREPRSDPRIGAEIELLPRDHETHAIPLLDGRLGEWLHSAAESGSWRSMRSAKGAPKYELPAGGTITLEPGGQVEYSSLPFDSPGALIHQIQSVTRDLENSARNSGLELMTVGIDPQHSLAATPLQLQADRYVRMDAYLRTMSDAGPRMMRQTTALQVSIDAAHDPVKTWHVLNRAAPILTALFANSRFYEGRDTGYASYRAEMWRELDPSRTGVCNESADPASEYAKFAMAARSIADAPHYRPFAELGHASEQDWDDHLSTLFPEVRPRQHFEMRCMDMLPVEHIAAPLLIVAALAWDAATLHEAAEVLPVASDDSLVRAARYGMRDPAITRSARELVALTERACERRGEEFCGHEDVVVLRHWLMRSLAACGAPFENDFVCNDHVSNNTLACLGE